MAIEPDTKDWTWVLERPCPACGFDVRSFPREEVSSLLKDCAKKWQQVLERPGCAERPREDKWSPLEYGCHVRDVFRLYDERLQMMVEQEDPLYPNWDQDATAVEDHYGEQDPERVSEELASAAEALAARFDGLSEDDWERPGRRSDGASFTVETFARYFIHDPIHHLSDV